MTARTVLTVFFLAVLAFADNAAACRGAAPTFSFNQTITLTYTGAAATAVLPITVKTPPAFQACIIGISLAPDPYTSTLQHTQNNDTLTYSVGSPFWFSGYDFAYQFQASPNQTIEIQVPIHIPANQSGKPAGTYQRLFNVRLRNVVYGGYHQQADLWVNALVAPVCTLPPPSLAVMDFSAAVHNGAIPTAFQRTLAFDNAGCNGPARLTLSGQPMKPAAAGTIHYTANATLGGTPVTLDTRAATTSFATNISAAASGQIPLTVTVLPSPTPLPAGRYTSSLRISLEPAQ